MKKILCVLLLVLLVFFNISLAFSGENPYKVDYEPLTAILETESYSFVSHPTDGWGINGDSPYIHGLTPDYPLSYTSEGGTATTNRGDWQFENLPSNARNVTQVRLYIYVANLGSGGSTATVNLHAWNSTYGWDDGIVDYKITKVEGSGWTLEFVNWAQYGTVKNVQEVNEAKLYVSFVTPRIGTSPTIAIDYAYLNVTAEVEVPWAGREYNVRYVLGLVGLTLMVAAPTYGVWEIRQKNYEGAVSAFVVSAIGYAFTLAWLIP